MNAAFSCGHKVGSFWAGCMKIQRSAVVIRWAFLGGVYENTAFSCGHKVGLFERGV